MIIRKAKPQDIERISELANQFLNQINSYSKLTEIEKLSKSQKKKDIEGWRKSLKKPDKNFFTFVAEENGKILAYLELIIKPNAPKQYFKIKEYGWIEFILVDEKLRKHGIGQKMFDFAIKFFKKHKIDYVRISFFLKNKLGEHFWTKNKFKAESFEMMRRI